MASAKQVLHYAFEAYQPTAIRLAETMTTQQARAEYSRLRDIAQKRLKRLGESEFSGTDIYVQNVGQFPKLADIDTPSDLAAKLNQVARFLTSQHSTVSGQRSTRRKVLKNLHSQGFTREQVNEENYLEFMRFMDSWREIDKMNKQRDSERVMELFYQAKRLNIDPASLFRDFSEWYEGADKLQEIERRQTRAASPTDAGRLRKKLGIGKEKLTREERANRRAVIAELREQARR